MIHFKLSAPSRLSLFGEYAVKHGRSGITSCLNLRTMLKFTELSYEECFIQMEFPQINLSLKIHLQEFLDLYDISSLDKGMNRLHEQVLEFVTSCCSYRTNRQRMIAQAFLYLLVYIAYEKQIDITRSFNVHLSTQLLLDADFVCLASITVCFSACFLQWSNLQSGASNKLSDTDLEEIVSYARRCKEISVESDLIDVTVCTFGSVVKHYTRKNAEGIVVSCITPIYNMPSITILLVDSNWTQNLEAQAQQITDLLNIYPVVANYILDYFDIATDMAMRVLTEIWRFHMDTQFDIDTKYILGMLQHVVLNPLILMNQRLLHFINLSTPNLDQICSIAQVNQLYGKYTDIGEYGRYAYIWCPPNTPKELITDVSNKLKRYHFDTIETNLACDGVNVEDD